MWISDLSINLVDCTLTLLTTSEPDRGQLTFRLTFSAVGNVQINRYHDADTDTLGDFTGIRVVNIGEGRARFQTDTGDALLEFEASDRPMFEPLTEGAVQQGIFIHEGRSPLP